MINGMNIFYGSKTGSGLKVVSTNNGKGLEPVQNKSKKEDLVTKNVIKSNLKAEV